MAEQGRPLEGKRALVVGGGSGIGYGCAQLLAADGAMVTIGGRTESKLEAAAADLSAQGREVTYVVCDARDATSVRAAVASSSDDQGRLDIAVVVPGAATVKPVLLFDDDEFMDQVAANLAPVWLTLKHAGQAMVRNGSGSFVAISSTAAVFSARYLSAYCAGKAAVDHLVHVAADELGPFGVRVNSVRPGMTETPATRGTFKDPHMIAAFLDRQPLGRTGAVGDVAAAVRYLSGPESGWVTGQCLAVDGGHTLRSFVDYAELIPIPDIRAAILGEAGAEE
jgi:NAD(P)-dependent dehydrogenase (short-subunit alcohol dehydrogenase family)